MWKWIKYGLIIVLATVTNKSVVSFGKNSYAVAGLTVMRLGG